MVEVDVLQYIPALGVIVALLYYSITIRNTEKLRRKEVLFQIQAPRSLEYMATGAEVLRMHDYSSHAEYIKKYTEEQRLKANYMFFHFCMIGSLVRYGIASVEELFPLYPTAVIISHWEIQEIMIQDVRVSNKDPTYGETFELLYREARKKNPDFVVSWKRATNPKKEE